MPLTNLRSIREEQALSMRALAQRARVSPATVLRAEQGHRIYPTSVRKLAKALGVTPAGLRGAEPPATPRAPLDASLDLTHARAEADWARREGDLRGAARWEQTAARIAREIAGSAE